MERSDFVALTGQIIATIPAEYLAKIDNLTFVVEEWAPPELLAEYDDADPLDFLGEYLGCPLPERSQGDAGGLPDLIALYQGAIEAYAEEFDVPIEEVIRETLIHEIAHYFGFSEEQMDDIETLWQENRNAGLP
ncbi:MAG: metallopeptidase family protein [Desulfuromonadales bacterium]|nr:metallopeptidase family protein [Desulfuromonadales bacterium]